MAADENSRRSADSTRTDQIGKVFFALSQNRRECLICECVFTRKDAADHADTICVAERKNTTEAILPSRCLSTQGRSQNQTNQFRLPPDIGFEEDILKL
jgi:hypothetical protein